MPDITKKHKPDETHESCNDILSHSPLELVLSCVRDFKLPEALCNPNSAYSAEKGSRQAELTPTGALQQPEVLEKFIYNAHSLVFGFPRSAGDLNRAAESECRSSG